MELDRTHVVIRKRMQTEIADLALVMIRRYPSALFVGFTLGALPWAVGNAVLLGWLPIREAAYGFGDQDASSELFRYLAWMGLLVVAQAPAAGVWTTYFLGQAVFERQPTWSNVRREINRRFATWIWRLGVLRLPLVIMVLLLFRLGQPFNVSFDVVLYLFLGFLVVAIRSGRPFLPEVLLLEQCPAKSTDPRTVTLARRMRTLHHPVAGELTSRMLLIAIGAFFAVIAIYFSLATVRGVLLGQWETDSVSLLVLYPLSLWLVAGWSVFFRLLSYLDTRIRLEGWEVELAVRAEELRQFDTEFPGGSSRQPA